jgi:hypothetical protein
MPARILRDSAETRSGSEHTAQSLIEADSADIADSAERGVCVNVAVEAARSLGVTPVSGQPWWVAGPQQHPQRPPRGPGTGEFA